MAATAVNVENVHVPLVKVNKKGKVLVKFMLPLTFVKTGDLAKVIKVSGRDNVKKHLADLGFVDGTIVNVISSHDGDIILNVKDSRLAVTREMADKIMIELVDRKDLLKAKVV